MIFPRPGLGRDLKLFQLRRFAGGKVNQLCRMFFHVVRIPDLLTRLVLSRGGIEMRVQHPHRQSNNADALADQALPAPVG